jgi:YD repeat-containing protein
LFELFLTAAYDQPPVRATRINHVSILANDLDESARFYEELFGMERIPTPRFEEPVLWLRLGDQQLHLFERPVEAPRYHHFAVDVDDFEAFYLRAKEMGLLDNDTFGAQLRAHPTGWVQLYLRDPAGNLVEIDWPDAGSLVGPVAAEIRRLDDELEQTGEAAVATLYLVQNAAKRPA